MSETLNSKTVEAETQIHVTGIVVAAPIGGELSATANFTKSLVDPDTGEVIQSLPWNAEENGAQQVSLDQDAIMLLITNERFAAIREGLHDRRRAAIPADEEPEGDA